VTTWDYSTSHYLNCYDVTLAATSVMVLLLNIIYLSNFSNFSLNT